MRRDDPGPYALEVLAAMQPPQVFTTDQAALRARYIRWFEEASGRTLYPVQVEMLLIETLAYAMGMMGEEGQAAAEQHLVAFANAAGLAALGPNRSTPRLPAAKARVTLRFALTAARLETTLIPAGTRVGSGDVIFATLAPAVIAIGATSVDAAAEAESAGSAGNGFILGQIATVLDPIAGVTATNITVPDGGAGVEAVDLYRLRVANAFERISTGGSFAWYRETAMGVSSAIIDMAVVRPQPCYIDLYPLTLTGAAGVGLRDQVAAAFDTPEIREIRFGDLVTVKPSVSVAGAPVLAVRTRGAAATITEDARLAGEAVLTGWRQRLGADVAPSDVEAAVKVLPGVVDAELAGLPFAQLQPWEYLDAAALVVNTTVLS